MGSRWDGTRRTSFLHTTHDDGGVDDGRCTLARPFTGSAGRTPGGKLSGALPSFQA